jgi:hypothetical protein
MPRSTAEQVKHFASILIGNPPTRNPYCILAEFDTPGDLLNAARSVREAGYRDYDTYSPFPIHGMDKAMGMGPSLVPWIVLSGGVTGLLAGLLLQTWINVYEYPLVISDKPFFSLPAFIPVIFELTVLFSAFGAIGAMLITNLLPMFYHPLLKHEGFKKVTCDSFFLEIESRDENFDEKRTLEFLESLGGQKVVVLGP